MLVIIMFPMCVLISICSIRYVAQVNKKNDAGPLSDRLHSVADRFECVMGYHWVPDVVIALYAIMFVVLCSDKVGDFLTILSVLLVVRAVSYCVTLLPACDKGRDTTFIRGSVWEVVKYYVAHPFKLGGTNDLLFSGHCSFLTLLGLFLGAYVDDVGYLFLCKVVLWTGVVGVSLLIVLLKRHYTIDILYAFIVTHYCFGCYFGYFGRLGGLWQE